jgi:putative membrane protein
MRTFREFWTEAFALRGSITPKVMPHVIGLGALAAVVCVAEEYFEQRSQIRLALAVSPHEIIGTVLGLLLVLRTNAGHERWWERASSGAASPINAVTW